MTTYTLVDAETFYPEKLDIPDRDERQGLYTGDCAKLVFEQAPQPEEGRVSERMWVEVRKVMHLPNGPVYVGVLDSTPAMISTLKQGDEISFAPNHVIDIDPLPSRSM